MRLILMQAAAPLSAPHRFFHWAQQTGLGTAVRDSRVAFPIIEILHFLGMVMLLGSALILNARFFGLGLRRQTTSELASDFAPWTKLGLALMVVSGIPMFAAKADAIWDRRLYEFIVKLALIAAAFLFHYLVLVPKARQDAARGGRWAAAVSLSLWFGTAIAGLSLEFL